MTVMDEKKTTDKMPEDSEFVPMLDRWEASSGDFVVEPPGKRTRLKNKTY